MAIESPNQMGTASCNRLTIEALVLTVCKVEEYDCVKDAIRTSIFSQPLTPTESPEWPLECLAPGGSHHLAEM